MGRLREGLSRAREGWAQRLDSLLKRQKWDPELLEEMEEILITADVGVRATQRLLDVLGKPPRDEELSSRLKEEIIQLMGESVTGVKAGERYSVRPWVVLLVGVNGAGKTTTIAKLAAQQRHAGKKVMLAAADTFRAAAIEQLEIWGQRVGAEVIKHRSGQDPSGVVYDAVQAARRRQVDLVLIDTAGRLHTKMPLLEEIKKMQRVVGREVEGAPHETLLVLDAPITE